jgi:PTH1 family peptidyl-tRNA hydrolase
MILIVGLGNPGPKFEKTRHNMGFRVVDEFAKENNYLGFEFSKKFKAEINEKEINGKKIILAKPQTFMNKSGKAVKIISRSYKLEANHLIVVHDDIDLDFGKIKIVENRSAAGHNGIQSIINELGTKNFVRIRIGIKPREAPADSFAARRARQNTKFLAGFVLKKFTKEEEKILKGIVEKATEAIEFFLKNGLEKAMSEFNG